MNDSPYAGRRIALLTKHAKQRVIGPTLKQSLGCQVRTITTFDTDTLGTFTREIPRAGSQIEAARKKARIGMEQSGLPLGLGSEGSFSPDPFVGLFPWNIEYLVFIDDERGIEVVGIAQGTPMDRQLSTDTWAAAKKFAIESGFPKHHLVVRPDSASDLRIHKTLSTWKLFETAFHSAKAQSSQGQVFLENDLRAHANPTRMANIKRAAEDLAKKLACACPQCETPGFSIVDRVKGLPCAQCSAPTEEIQAEVYWCQKCSFTRQKKRDGTPTADPGRCNRCNP